MCLSTGGGSGVGCASSDDHQVSLAGDGYVQGRGWVFLGGRYVQRGRDPIVYPLPPPLLTPSCNHQNVCGWQVGGTHPTGMPSCSNIIFVWFKWEIFDCSHLAYILLDVKIIFSSIKVPRNYHGNLLCSTMSTKIETFSWFQFAIEFKNNFITLS